MKLMVAAVLLSVSLVAMACQPVMPVTEESGADLAGTTWMLTELGDEALPEGVTVTAVFGEDGSLSGSAGCNNYNTSYEADGQNLTVSPQIMTTMMMCPDPAMQVEQGYVEALVNVASFEMSADTLVLSDASGAPLLTFAAQSQSLAGTSWTVVSYNNGNQAVVSVLDGTELTASFEDDGSVGGSAGCNTYFGPVTTDGDQISIGPLAMTSMMCENEAVMEQEMQFLMALESAATYQVEGSQLRMRTADDAMAVNLAPAE